MIINSLLNPLNVYRAHHEDSTVSGTGASTEITTSPAINNHKPIEVNGLNQSAKGTVNRVAALSPIQKPSKTAYGINEYVLDNGLRVVMIPHGTLNFKASLVIKSGSNSDPPGEKGIAHFVEHMCGVQSSDEFKAWERDMIVELIGDYFNAWTANEATFYEAETLPDTVDLTLTMLASILKPRDFIDRESDLEKNVIHEEMEETGKDGEEHYNPTQAQIFASIFCENDPRRYTIDGTNEDLQNLNSAKGNKFHKQHYIPNNAVLILSGQPIVDNEAAVLQSVANTFGSIKAGSQPNKPELFAVKAAPKDLIKIESPYSAGLEIIYPFPTKKGSTSLDQAKKVRLESILDPLAEHLNNKFKKDPNLSNIIDQIELSEALSQDCIGIKITSPEYLDEDEAHQIINYIHREIKKFTTISERALREPLQEQYELNEKFKHGKQDTYGERPTFITDIEESGLNWHEGLELALEIDLNSRILQSTIQSVLNKDNARVILLTPGESNTSTDETTIAPIIEPQEINPKLVIPNILRDKYELKNLIVEAPSTIEINGPHSSKVHIIRNNSRTVHFAITQPQLTPSTITTLTEKMLEESGVIDLPARSKKIMPAKEFTKALKAQGAGLSLGSTAEGDDEHLKLSFSMKKEKSKRALDLLKCFLSKNNLFNNSDDTNLNRILERVKQEMLFDLEEKFQQPEYKAAYISKRKAFPDGHPLRPLSRRELRAELDTISLEDIRKHARSNFKLDNATVEILGDINQAEYERSFIPLLESFHSNDPRSQNVVTTLAATEINRPIIHSKSYQATQSSAVSIGNTFIINPHADINEKYTMKLIDILITLKLRKLLREDQGLAYGADFRLGYPSYSNHGYYSITLNQKSNGEKMASIIKKFLSKVVKEGFTQEEIYLSKLYLINAGRKQILDYEIPKEYFKGGFETIRNKIVSLSEEAINKRLREIIKPNQLITVLAA